MSIVARVIQVDRTEALLFALSLLTMGSVRLVLFFWSPRQISRVLEKLNRAWPRKPGAPKIALNRLVKRVSQASRLSPVPTTCLSEAIAAKALLARYGHSGELRIGVRKNDDRFQAHAWLECADGLLIGNPNPDGTPYVTMTGVEGLIR